ncbi:recombinase family protein [Nitrosophilus labii]|uniref:recombinase family protein n=1 Tax=Nitrosophilus labii TaxID=2706014 RepID=UPI001656A30A|nr:recombinase family protein [Nitrosophilus labii]
MNYVYLRTQNSNYSIAVQENSIDEYVLRNNLIIDEKKVEVTPYSQSIDDRKDFIEFLQSLKDGDKLFIYDLSVFSMKVGEIVKILNCIFKKDIDIFISRFNIKLNYNTQSKIIIYLLNEVRENCKKIKKRSTGRPKGSLSKSKYDMYREKIITLLKEGKSVNEISKILNVSRSSLRDYISSRNLKELAATEGEVKREGEIFILPKSECKILRNSNKG